jgi:hypothetical protein
MASCAAHAHETERGRGCLYLFCPHVLDKNQAPRLLPARRTSLPSACRRRLGHRSAGFQAPRERTVIGHCAPGPAAPAAPLPAPRATPPRHERAAIGHCLTGAAGPAAPAAPPRATPPGHVIHLFEDLCAVVTPDSPTTRWRVACHKQRASKGSLRTKWPASRARFGQCCHHLSET